MIHRPRLLILSGWLLFGGFAGAQVVQPNTNLSADELASRFLGQATFGPTAAAIAELRSNGYDFNAWIDREVAKPPTYSAPLVVAALASGGITKIQSAQDRRARNQAMIAGDDQ